MKSLVEVTVPKTKAELVRALSGTSVNRLSVNLVSGAKLDSSVGKTVEDWRRGKRQVLVVLLDLGAER